jgi:UDP-GlcNAc3NAcA epimerase
LQQNNFILATIHRQENTDNIENLKAIFKGLERIAKQMQVVIPIHPRTRKILENNKLKFDVTFVDPVGYFDMLELLKNCKMVVTDSGGLQKEAFFNKKHCIIAREETEWVELVENGFATIVGSNAEKIEKAFNTYLTSGADFSKKLYGENVGDKMYEQVIELIQ